MDPFVTLPHLQEANMISSTIYLSIYVRVFVSLFAVNAKTTARIDVKRSGIMKNDSECVLCGLKSSVLVFSERYHDISGFPIAADHHFYLSPFHFRFLPRLPFNPPTLTELYCNIMIHNYTFTRSNFQTK